MCGSGTVVRESVEAGHFCLGRDVDPLAVLMTRAWVTPVDPFRLLHDAHEIVHRARAMKGRRTRLPWSDERTDEFAHYWFAKEQLEALTCLASALKDSRFRSRDLLKVCFSRVVITKDKGASLARDVSHSRPHRVATTNDFDVYEGFLRAARVVANRLDPHDIRGTADVERGDARDLRPETSGRFDAAMTSPPYLNAIDYLRGHRLSLIWFGYSLDELQRIRSLSTGSERGLDQAPFDIGPYVSTATASPLESRFQGWIRRYAADIAQTLLALRSVVLPGGRVILVVGNSLIRGAAVDNAGIIAECARLVGLEFVASDERAIPARRRYLPPPVDDGSPFSNRMRSESVLTFRVPAVSRTLRAKRPLTSIAVAERPSSRAYAIRDHPGNDDAISRTSSI
jgi:hypothetical protein